jgi:transglutaminase-like putative cysteine protease
MLIRSEFDIQFDMPQPTPMLALLNLYPTLDPQMRGPETLHVDHLQGAAATRVASSIYIDTFGNRCARFVAPAGALRLTGQSLYEAAETPDLQGFGLPQVPVEDLPEHTLRFLLASRYCQVDQFGSIAMDLFGYTTPGWSRAAAIRDWVHTHVAFNYKTARSTKTALDVYLERIGVCRDYQHLAVTLTRCMNIPARYVTGYLGDIRLPFSGIGDFSAWYQVWLDGRWWDMDARHNEPRLGRTLMAAGRDAADVAITTSFGVANLTKFYVESFEVDAQGNKVPLPAANDAAFAATALPPPIEPQQEGTPTQQGEIRSANPS